jgi:hypothetical protein
VNVELFKEQDFEIERYFFENPKMKINYKSGLGIPTKLSFTQLKFYNKDNVFIGTPNGDDMSMLLNGVDIESAPNNGFLVDSIELNKTNSDLQDLVKNRPRWIDYQAQIWTEARDNTTVTKGSRFEANVTLELPLWGDMYNFVYSDTSEFELPEIVQRHEPIKRARIRLDMLNGFAGKMLAQVYLIDENTNTIIDSLIPPGELQVLEGAKVDINDKPVVPMRKISYIEVTREQLKKWKDVKNVIYKVRGHTWEVNPPEVKQKVKIYPDDKVTFRIGLEVDVDIEGNIDTIIQTIKDTINN